MLKTDEYLFMRVIYYSNYLRVFFWNYPFTLRYEFSNTWYLQLSYRALKIIQVWYFRNDFQIEHARKISQYVR